MAAQAQTGKTSEVTLRRMALTSVTPTYPASSVKAGLSGIAVADLVTAPAGDVQSVEILEAPDPAIGEAVRAALGQWKFPAMPRPMQAKMTFYFRIEQGKGRVVSPQDIPGGPRIERRPPANFTPENPPPVAKPPTQ